MYDCLTGWGDALFELPCALERQATGKRGSQRPRALLLIARVLRCFALQDSQASVVVREFRQVR